MKIDYDDFMEEKKRLAAAIPLRYRNPKRGAKRRPRDPEERRVLMDAVCRRVERALETGELKFVSNRRIIFKL